MLNERPSRAPHLTLHALARSLHGNPLLLDKRKKILFGIIKCEIADLTAGQDEQRYADMQ